MGATAGATPLYDETYAFDTSLGNTLGPGLSLGCVRKVIPVKSTRSDGSVYPPSANQIGGTIMLAYNDSGGTLVQGQVVTLKVDETKVYIRKAPVSTSPAGVAGVVVAPDGIPTGYLGWIAVDGIWKVLAGTGGITKDTALTVDGTTAGTATDVAGATGMAFAYARETKTATNLALCHILPRPGSTAQF